MNIRTSQPISDGSFVFAWSADGRFSWMSGADGSVGITCESSGLTDNTLGRVGKHIVYLQYGEDDHELSPALLADCRAFHQSVNDQLAANEAAIRSASLLPHRAAPTLPSSRIDPATTWCGNASMEAEDSIF